MMSFERHATIAELGPPFAARAAAHDEEGDFVAENYADLKDLRAFSAMIPESSGGSRSNTVTIENAFVSAEAITLGRPLGKYHGVWSIVFGVAWPLLGAAYLGTARRVCPNRRCHGSGPQ